MQEFNISLSHRYESDTINKNLVLESWAGHRDFAYDLIQFVQPEKIVELGTHHGCSFFAMAQAIKDFKLKTKLIAVDTWQGEEHAGYYDESVWTQFEMIKNTHYRQVDIEINKICFDEALKLYPDDFFDLIHIDGLHTYDAVTHDYTTWLPKLKKNGIILFHDVYSLPHFGTNRFWQEIKQQYEFHLEFIHCYGLGVLFPKGDKWYKKLIKTKFKEVKIVYDQRYLYNQAVHKKNEINFQLSQAQSDLSQSQSDLSQSQSDLSQTKNYLSTQYENNTLFKIVKKRLEKKLVHPKSAQYPKIVRYVFYFSAFIRLLLSNIFR